MGFSISEIANGTGVSSHTLRYYERIGLLDPVERSNSGHRSYGDDDIGRIEFLTLLRQTGMPIQRMQDFMDLTRVGDETLPERIELLEQHLDDIEVQLENRRACETAVRNKLDIYRSLQPGTGARDNSMPISRFILLRERGPQWDDSVAMRSQDHWDAHAEFMDALVDDGFVVEGGPVGDEKRILLVVNANNDDEVRDRLAPDPWEQHGILVSQPADRWTVILTAPLPA